MASVELKKFTDANFAAEVLNSQIPTLVDFWATWCGPCRQIAPFVEAIAAAYAGKLSVGKLDIDSSQRIPTQYDVRSIPTLLLFHQGKVVGQMVGARTKAKIEEFLHQSLAKVGVTLQLAQA